MKLCISISISARLYHFSSELRTYLVSIYRRNTYTFRWYSRISRLEHRRDYHNHAHDYPCIRMIFSQPAHCRTISETPDTNSISDTLHRRSLYGYYRIFYWRPPLSPPDRTLYFNRTHDRKDAEKCIN